MDEIKLLIAYEQPIFIEGLSVLIKENPHFTLSAIAYNGLEVLQKIPISQPDIIIMDTCLPEINGIETCKIILERYTSIKVILLTSNDNIEVIKEVLESGARGYILKNTSKEELIKAIETVFEGKPYLSHKIQEKMIESLQKINEQDAKTLENDNLITSITKREIEVLNLIADGMTSNDIANKLLISKNTVETHRKNLLSKAKVKNTAALLQIAYKMGLL